jgi:hypothetical protein
LNWYLRELLEDRFAMVRRNCRAAIRNDDLDLCATSAYARNAPPVWCVAESIVEQMI